MKTGKEEKPRITQISFDVEDNNIDLEKIAQILEDNGIVVWGSSNEYSWSYDEYFK